MKFLDANVFLYAFLKAHSTEDGRLAKKAAQTILARLQNGEKVLTSVVHLSEVANIAEDKLPFDQQKRLFESIMLNNSIEVKAVDKQLYSLAVEYAMDHKIGVNDALAVVVMQKENIQEIYSFDSDFDVVSGIVRLTK